MLKLTDDNIKRNTHWSQLRYNNMKKMIEAYEKDEDVLRRQRDLECKSCYYLREGGSLQAFWDYKCRNCGSDETWHNSNHPKYCEKCAREHAACRRCGADI